MSIRPRNAVRTMQPYHPPLQGRADKLRLDFNENTVGPPKKIIQALGSLSPADLATYPESMAFTKKLADHLGVDAEKVLVTNATDEAIRIVMDTFAERGSTLLLPVPSFAMYRFYAELAEMKIDRVFYNDDWSFPTAAVLEKAAEKPGMLIIGNPNNPMGTSPTRDDLIRILEAMPETAVLADEAYTEFAKFSALDLVDRFDNLLVSRTFSKTYGLAGLRLGYIVACAKNAEHLRKAAPPYSVNIAAMTAASAALDDPSYTQAFAQQCEAARKMLLDGMKEMGIETRASLANFVIGFFGDKARLVQNSLAHHGVLVRDRSSDPMMNGWVRVTAGTPEQAQAFLSALQQVLQAGDES